MLMRIWGDKWNAQIIASDAPSSSGHWNFQVDTFADSKEEALKGAEFVLNFFAAGRNAFVRVKPEAISEKEFESGQTYHKGYVRFAVKPEAGSWYYSEPAETHFVGLGAA